MYANEVAEPSLSPYFRSSSGDFIVYEGNCLGLLGDLDQGSIDLIITDPPYFLSNGGITCKSGRMVKVDKGTWDISNGLEANHHFNLSWLRACQRILRPNGSIFVSGTSHVIFSVGYAMQQLGFRILNDITWYKVTPPPNLSCRYFTHCTETIIWAGRDMKSKHYFDYQEMKRQNGGKQMQSLWSFRPPLKAEKRFGKHPTQKPLALMERIVSAASAVGDLVVDPFAGSGTTGIACARLGRSFIGIDLDPSFLELATKRYLDLDGEVASPRPTRSRRGFATAS